MTLKMIRIPYSLTAKNLLKSCGGFTDLWEENHSNVTHIGYSDIMYGSRRVRKNSKMTISFVMSVRLSAWNNSLLTIRIFMKLYNEHFYKTYQENSSFIKIGQGWRVIYIKTNIHFWAYLSQFELEWKTFQKKVLEKMKTYILDTIMCFENCAVYEISGNILYINILYIRTGHRWQYGAC